MRRFLLINIFLGFGVLHAQPNHFDTLHSQYLTHFNKGEFANARRVADMISERARKAQPKNGLELAIALRYKGEAYYYEGLLDSALFFYTRAHQILKQQRKEDHIEFGYVSSGIASYYMNVEEYKKAEPFQIAAVNVYKQHKGQENNYAEATQQLGVLYNQLGLYNKALPHYLEALSTYKKKHGREHENVARVLYYLGILYYNLDDYTTAEAYYKEALAMREVCLGREHPDYRSNLEKVASFLYDMNKYEDAEVYYKKLLWLIETTDGEENDRYLECLKKVYHVYAFLRNFDSIQLYTKKALDLTGRVCGTNHSEYAEVLGDWAGYYRMLDENKPAKIYLEEASSIIRNVHGEASDEYADALYRLGNAYSDLSNYDSALYYLNKALRIWLTRSGENNINCVNAYFSIGVAHREKGDYKTGEWNLQRAIDIAKNINSTETDTYSSILSHLGSLNRMIGNYKAAEKQYQMSLLIRKRIYGTNDIEYATGLNLMGILYNDLTMYEKADSFYKQALEIKRKYYGEDHPNYINQIRNMGVLYYNMGKYEEAIEIYKLVQDYIKRRYGTENTDYTDVLNYIGILLSSTNNSESNRMAETYFCETLDIQKKLLGESNPEYVNTLAQLSDLYASLEEFPTADFYFRKALQYKNKDIQKNFAWLTATEREMYWKQESEYFKDLSKYACAAFESVPSAAELSYNANLMEKSILLETSRSLEAILTQTSDKNIKSIYSEAKRLRIRYNQLRLEGQQMDPLAEQIQSTIDSLDKLLMGALDLYAESKKRFGVTWQDVQSNLASNEAAIEFVRYMDDSTKSYKYFALVNRKTYTYPQLIKIGTETEIKRALAGKDLASLYNLTWHSIDPFLQGITTVYYSPVGELNNIPFNALCEQRGMDSVVVAADKRSERGLIIERDDKTTSCRTFLLDKYDLHQLTTTRYLADGTLKKTTPLGHSAYLVGGINYDTIPAKTISKEKIRTDIETTQTLLNREIGRVNFIRGQKGGRDGMYGNQYLPGTYTEVKNIGSLLEKENWNVQIRGNSQANEKLVKGEISSKQPGILHIATHGFAIPEESTAKGTGLKLEKEHVYAASTDPMIRCGLMLSGSNISWLGNSRKMIQETGEDGILTAAEVSTLDLSKTKLVILSACETGLGKIEGSEGTFGLKRGFKLAGVEQLVVSLWKVPDTETMELMTLFYKDLTKSLDPIASFQYAQKTMRVKYPWEPTKWAGFVLVR